MLTELYFAKILMISIIISHSNRDKHDAEFKALENVEAAHRLLTIEARLAEQTNALQDLSNFRKTLHHIITIHHIQSIFFMVN